MNDNACLYKKLDITKKEFKNLLILKYFVFEMSQREIANELNCHVNHVGQWF